ncbi:MAG: ABC transporter permease [Candidatus Pacebacteria bacterium]|nr:ABC transporter permease [Candidatus Paceibacterota bacterium]
MKTALKFTGASMKMFFRNKSGVFWTLFLPLLIMIIFGSMNFENYGKSNIAIVDNAETKESKNLIKEMEKVDIISVKKMNEKRAMSKLKEGDFDLVMILPSDFLENPDVAVIQKEALIQGKKVSPSDLLPKTSTIKIYYNKGKEQQALAGTTVLKEMFNNINREITGAPSLFKIEEEAISAKNLKYIDFLIPGIVAMAIMQMGVFSIVFVLVQYRKKGIMKRLLVTPMKSIDFIAGQVLTRIFVSIMQVVVIVGVAVLVFDINVVGNYFLILLLVSLGSLLFISMGFAMSSFAKTEESAAPIANIVVFPMLFLSGVFFPIEAMPAWLQGISKYLPLTYLANGLRSVMTEGVKIAAIKSDVLGLLVWSIIMIIFAILFFRLNPEE